MVNPAPERLPEVYGANHLLETQRGSGGQEQMVAGREGHRPAGHEALSLVPEEHHPLILHLDVLGWRDRLGADDPLHHEVATPQEGLETLALERR
jgi:hypothetical protein